MLLQGAMLLAFTIIISLLVGLIIIIHPYFYGTSHFFANGEALHVFSSQDQALLIFSITYGVLYISVFFICLRILARTRLAKGFIQLATKIRRRLHFRRGEYAMEYRIITMASQFMTSCILLILYPLAIHLLFPQLEMTMIGNVTIFVFLFIFSIVPAPGTKRYRARERRYHQIGPFKTRF